MPRFVVLIGVPALWMLVDALCLHFWAATPGKALLGLRVLTAEGAHLPMRAALRRAFDVWFFGYGMDLYLLTWVLRLTAMSRLRHLGSTSWDDAGKYVVEHRTPSTLGVTVGLTLFIGVIALNLYCFFHTPLPSHLDPEERAFFETVHPASQRSATEPAPA